jgi:hypothetical protein
VDDVDFETAAHVVWGWRRPRSTFRWTRTTCWQLAIPRENRQQFTPLEYETVYLPGLNATELTDVVNLAKNVFNVQQVVAEPTSGTITIRASQSTMNAFNATMRELLDGRNQVMLEVRLIQLAHTSTRNTGVQPPQSISAFNVYAEEQSILNANSEPGAADHLLWFGLLHGDTMSDSGHSAGLRPDIEFPVFQRRRPVWRRNY